MKCLIYDDNLDDINNLKNCLNNYFKVNKIEFYLEVCESMDKLMSCYSKYDWIFLDIQLGNNNGINIGLKLKEIGCKASIIITSKYSKYLIEGYRINAKRYLLKPLNQKVIDFELKELLNDYMLKNNYFIDPRIGNFIVHYHKILYVEYADRTCTLYFDDGSKVGIVSSLNYWKDKFHSFNFIQIHKTCIVNIAEITDIYDDIVILSNGKKILTSRKYKNEVQNAYMENLLKGL